MTTTITRTFTLNMTDEDGFRNWVGLPEPTPTNYAEVLEEVTNWAQDLYANSYTWLVPNVMHAWVKRASTEWVVPITSYNGPTGETELVTLTYIEATV